MKRKIYAYFIPFLCVFNSFAQINVLFEEGFDACEIPSSWTVENEGEAYYGVGQYGAYWNDETEQNDIPGFNGSCALWFSDNNGPDDDLPDWSVSVSSPQVDVSEAGMLYLNLKVDNGNWEENRFLKIEVYNGTNWVTLQDLYESWYAIDWFRDGYMLLDATAHKNENFAVRFSYADGGWQSGGAGVDDIQFLSVGQGNTVLHEDFNGCEMPAGWSIETDYGPGSWMFGFVDFVDWSFSPTNSCLASFNNWIANENLDVPVAQKLISPVFNGSDYAEIQLNCFMTYEAWGESTGTITLLYGNQEVILWNHQTYGEDEYFQGAWEDINISSYRDEQMQLIFEFRSEYREWWGMSVDDISITGNGEINDLCSSAVNVIVDDTCIEGNNQFALSNSLEITCSELTEGDLWYSFTSPSNGTYKISTNAQFNDIVTLYSGNCTNLNEMDCYDEDTFGFTGESVHFYAPSGAQYFIRVSGLCSEFGNSRGTLCLSVESISTVPTSPSNDFCNGAEMIGVGDDCYNGTTMNASFSGIVPSKNNKTNSDVWFSFAAPNSGNVTIHSDADFSDVITLYAGSCSELNEVVSNELGQSLYAEGLTPNQDYFVQLGGYFSTIEGSYCISIEDIFSAPMNDYCIDAYELPINGACLASNLSNATMDNLDVSCQLYSQSNVWYSFIAPSSGSSYLRVDAENILSAAIYSGSCGSLEEEQCFERIDPCSGSLAIDNLSPNESYYIQIASAVGQAELGSVCVSIEEKEFDAIVVRLEVLLEGAMDDTGIMNDQLNNSYLIPSMNPYGVDFAGCVNEVPANAVDWVLVQARNENDPSIVEGEMVGFLNREGVLIQQDGSTGVTMRIAAGDYFLSVYHRAHLAVMSSDPVSLPNYSPYDFTTPNQSYGLLQQIVVNGNYAMYAGDYDQNGVINNVDFNLWNSQNAAVNSYFSWDADCNGVINNVDYNYWFGNRSKVGNSLLYD